MKRHPSVDVIIITNRPDAGFSKVLSALEGQTYPPSHIIVIDTDEKYWKDRFTDYHPGVEVYHIKNSKYDPGAARNMGAELSSADILVFISQDALPAGERFISRVVRSFGDGRSRAVYGRRIADYGAGPLDTIELLVAYPEISESFTRENIRSFENSTHLFSNICAAYDRQYFFENGGFAAPAVSMEDVIFARNMVDSGEKITYNSRIEVMHYYRNSALKSFKKGFDTGVMTAAYPEELDNIRPHLLDRQIKKYLKEEGSFGLFIRYCIRKKCGDLGVFLGKRSGRIPSFLCRLMSNDRNYWIYKRYKESSFESSEI